jgi:hypothetical protein
MAETTLGGPVRTTETGFQVVSIAPSTGAVTVLATFGADTSVTNVTAATSITTAALTATGAVILSGLPTSDPAVAGQLWNDTGTLKVSAG